MTLGVNHMVDREDVPLLFEVGDNVLSPYFKGIY